MYVLLSLLQLRLWSSSLDRIAPMIFQSVHPCVPLAVIYSAYDGDLVCKDALFIHLIELSSI